MSAGSLSLSLSVRLSPTLSACSVRNPLSSSYTRLSQFGPDAHGGFRAAAPPPLTATMAHSSLPMCSSLVMAACSRGLSLPSPSVSISANVASRSATCVSLLHTRTFQVCMRN